MWLRSAASAVTTLMAVSPTLTVTRTQPSPRSVVPGSWGASTHTYGAGGGPDPSSTTWHTSVWFTGRPMWTITIPKATPAPHAEFVLLAYVTGEMLAPGSYEFVVRTPDASAAPEAVASYEVSIGG